MNDIWLPKDFCTAYKETDMLTGNANSRLNVFSISTGISVSTWNESTGFWMIPFEAVTGLYNNETELSTHFYIGWDILEMNIHLDF